DSRLLDIAKLFADGVGSALIPVLAGVGGHLLGGQNLDEAARGMVEPVSLADVAVKADGEKLRQHVHLVEAAVDAVGERDVDQAVLAGEGHGRLAAVFCEGIEPRAATAAEDEGDDVLHDKPDKFGAICDVSRAKAWPPQSSCG